MAENKKNMPRMIKIKFGRVIYSWGAEKEMRGKERNEE